MTRRSTVTVRPMPRQPGCAATVEIAVTAANGTLVDQCEYSVERIPCEFAGAVAAHFSRLDLEREAEYDVCLDVTGATCTCIAAATDRVTCKHILSARFLAAKRLLGSEPRKEVSHAMSDM